jgi:hypothetical protein
MFVVPGASCCKVVSLFALCSECFVLCVLHDCLHHVDVCDVWFVRCVACVLRGVCPAYCMLCVLCAIAMHRCALCVVCWRAVCFACCLLCVLCAMHSLCSGVSARAVALSTVLKLE